jgi:ubiquinone/menaquinone biosynthesis C-methylase UbiE
MLDGALHLAPLRNPERVLDLATGTGIWAIEFGMSLHLRLLELP